MADTDTNKTTQAVEETLRSLGVARSFFDDLLTKGDDWTFIIKIHALVEAALTHLIVAELERPELADIIAKLETSDTRTGKVAFVKALKLLDDHHRRFVRALSELRNGLVHDVRNTSFSFTEPAPSLERRQSADIRRKAEKCVETASGYFKESFELGGHRATRKEFAKENPRLVIYFATFFTLGNIYHELGGGDPLVRALMKVRRQQSNSMQLTGKEQPVADSEH